jgi:hypothetical protein
MIRFALQVDLRLSGRCQADQQDYWQQVHCKLVAVTTSTLHGTNVLDATNTVDWSRQVADPVFGAAAAIGCLVV